MPLDVAELSRSSLAAKATGDGFRAAVMLWCAAWQQVPAGSLPDDDDELAWLAGFGRDLRSWKRAKQWALHKFELCTDGRFYHPIICEKAMEALPGRLAAIEQKNNTAERKRQERDDRRRMFETLRARGVVLAYDTPTSHLRRLTAPEALPLLAQPDGDDDVTGRAPVTLDVVTGHTQVTAKRERGTETEREKELDDGRAREIDWSTIKGLAEQLTAISEAAGIPLDPSRQRWSIELEHLKGWLAAGYDMQADIRPAIDRTLAGLPEGDTIGSLKMIDRQLKGARAKARVAPKPVPSKPAEPLAFDKQGETPAIAEWRAAAAVTVGAGPYRTLLDGARLSVDGEGLFVIRVASALVEAQLREQHLFRLEPLAQRFLESPFIRIEVLEHA